MKRLILFVGLVFTIGACISGCYKDVNLPTPATDPNGPPQQLSFKNDIAPILNTNCALSGCHVSGAQKPDMETAVSYNSLVNGGYVNMLIPNQSILYIMINGNMEEHIPSAVDRKKVYDWIRTGALNN